MKQQTEHKQQFGATDALFVSPKRGGILQSSGFLDLRSLMRLGQTCKSNALDELSLIQLIEHEITVRHRVSSMEAAMTSLKKIHQDTVLKQWLLRDSSASSIITPRDRENER